MQAHQWPAEVPGAGGAGDRGADGRARLSYRPQEAPMPKSASASTIASVAATAKSGSKTTPKRLQAPR